MLVSGLQSMLLDESVWTGRVGAREVSRHQGSVITGRSGHCRCTMRVTMAVSMSLRTRSSWEEEVPLDRVIQGPWVKVQRDDALDPKALGKCRGMTPVNPKSKSKKKSKRRPCRFTQKHTSQYLKSIALLMRMISGKQ